MSQCAQPPLGLLACGIAMCAAMSACSRADKGDVGKAENARPPSSIKEGGARVAAPDRRTLEELINRDEPGIELVRKWASGSKRVVEFLPADQSAGESALLALQITTRSPLGAITYETGGILVDDGWLRILGSGSKRLPRSVPEWNKIDQPLEQQRLPGGALLVADDVLGGFYALNGGAFSGERGNVYYLAPDILTWEDQELGFSEWLQFVFAGDLDLFYKDLRWPGWRDEVRKVGGDQGIAVYPMLFAEGDPIGSRSRAVVPIGELWILYAVEWPRQMRQQ